MLRNNTPIEPYRVSGRTIFVKREDLCMDGVSFSKVRGVAAHIGSRHEKVIGVLDTYHSKAGWGVSQICKALGKVAVVFYPEYKGEKKIRENQMECLKLGAALNPLPAGRSFILYNQARKHLSQIPDSYMMPNALKLDETVEETAREVVRSIREPFDHVVISISSATIAAGVMRGFQYLWERNNVPFPLFWLHCGYSRPASAIRSYITQKIGEPPAYRLVDEHYAYRDGITFECPFPCNPYYDLKAWAWFVYYTDLMPGKILFWNIGK